MNVDELMAAYAQMAVIRTMEQRIAQLYAAGTIPGFVHTSIGQEAVPVGVLAHARTSDVITSTHRGHGHVLAKGLSPRAMMAELLGRATGACGGRGGSMHVADPKLGIFGANGIVGAGLPVAVGAAHALRDTHDVVLCFFGDGAVATGAFHESMNLAALWSLPVVFVCENNGFSEFSRAQDQHPAPLAARAAAYAMQFRGVDGNDVEAIADTMAGVLAQVRGGSGPVLVEATTLRVNGHYEGDAQRYRIPGAEPTDPLAYACAELLARGVPAAEVNALDAAATAVVDDAQQWAIDSPEPDPATAREHVYAPLRRAATGAVATPAHTPSCRAGQDKPVSTSRILNTALREALAADPAVFLAGIDVGGGNVFGLTRGLAQEFPGRVLDTPIAETAIMGLGVGSAMAGMRPVVELMYLDFIGVCLDQLLNQAAKLRFMSGGAVSVPMVVRTQFGSGRSSGSQHSQSLEALLAHIPGLSVVMPSAPHEHYGLLRAAIEDDNPVVFIENRVLYERKGVLPSADYRVPLRQAAVVRSGTELTIVAWSAMVGHALAAADQLAAQGMSAEVIDLRTIVPLDRATVLASLRKTSRLLIAQEAVVDFGVGAELAALACREGFWFLDAPVARVGAPFTPAPYAPSLERAWQPDVAQIVTVAQELLQDR